MEPDIKRIRGMTLESAENQMNWPASQRPPAALPPRTLDLIFIVVLRWKEESNELTSNGFEE